MTGFTSEGCSNKTINLVTSHVIRRVEFPLTNCDFTTSSLGAQRVERVPQLELLTVKKNDKDNSQIK